MADDRILFSSNTLLTIVSIPVTLIAPCLSPEVDFQCLATWVNGEKYLYGSFSEPWMKYADNFQYRCFVSHIVAIIELSAYDKAKSSKVYRAINANIL